MKKAYTIVELLVVISLITIFSGIGLYFSQKIKHVNKLERAKIFLASQIHLARSLALSPRKVKGKQPSGFGIYIPSFPTDCFYLFADLDNNHQWTDSFETLGKFSLEKPTEISSANLSVGSVFQLHLFFAFPDAKVYFNGNKKVKFVEITLKEKNSGRIGKIHVNQLGQISF